jgi:NAD-dependent DNA ligase
MKNFLQKAAKAYYDGEPIISDAMFDYLSDKYGFEQVGAPQGDVKHLYRMYSLQKIYDDEPEKIEKALSKGDYVETPKLDGANLELVYNNGMLISATTRGDGITGKDCTHNIMTMDTVPKSIPYKNELQVIGEVSATKDRKNARNIAAGALNLKDSEEFKERDLTFIVHSIYPFIFSTYLQDMKEVEEWGFYSVADYKNFGIYQFPTDGAVFRLDNNSLFEELGHTDKHPRGAFALKERNEEEAVPTTLLNVVWQVGKGGQVTPVAIFEPVVIEGATINRATLHNVGFIEKHDLDIGDKILIVRAGKIIPKVIGKL